MCSTNFAENMLTVDGHFKLFQNECIEIFMVFMVFFMDQYSFYHLKVSKITFERFTSV